MDDQAKTISALLAGAVLVVAGTAFIIDEGDVTPTKPGDVLTESVADEKLMRLRDGGAGYLREAKQRDGGVGVVVSVTPGCARRPKGDRTCKRLDGGDPGELNRHPATNLTGAGCEAVACSVWAGDDADAPEKERLAADAGVRREADSK